ncbi:MAG: type IV pilus twitching motility protein PilT, partial [Candidatus Sericytochromatia bacterium]
MTTGHPQQAPAQQANPLLGILQSAVKHGAADIHLKAHLPPKAVLDGKVKVLPGYENVILDPRILPQMLFSMLPASQLELFKVDKEVDTAFEVPGLARFRANIFTNMGTVAAVLRVIQNDIRTTDDLGLPPVLKRIALEKQGLVLVTGPTGSGKSTTLAAMINFINEIIHGHLVTIEDPIELVHPHKNCIISQREVGKDTNSFGRALKSALRQAPNVILIGELRDRETIELALKGAETGHLVLSTLHTNDAVQTISRILNAFPPQEQDAMRITIANVLKCCIAQRLVPRSDGPGRVPVLDILVNTAAVRDQIMKGQLDQLYELIKNGGFDGMQSTNQALLNHYKNGVIEFSTAVSTAENKQDLMMMLRSEMRTIKEDAEKLYQKNKPQEEEPEEPIEDFAEIEAKMAALRGELNEGKPEIEVRIGKNDLNPDGSPKTPPAGPGPGMRPPGGPGGPGGPRGLGPDGPPPPPPPGGPGAPDGAAPPPPP